MAKQTKKINKLDRPHVFRFLITTVVGFCCVLTGLYFKDKEMSVFVDTVFSSAESGETESEGVLWRDTKGDNYVITLGLIHGIKTDDTFNILDNNAVIGEAKVINPLKKLSVVDISLFESKKLSKQYYRIVPK